jgi:hypothetical protein
MTRSVSKKLRSKISIFTCLPRSPSAEIIQGFSGRLPGP